ncbi:YraN family protein [Treponema brennaborense]|uniref:UPF0102 protein Trebr_0910 n=1 Tax=Treponema brennaborense (strain DSM 12168 / CIP 105900 / DD5/3) TaxID=906968 RepID=F4LJ89_TREBD|nr:YraN family protein [Treponema brennaborense]AEE16346.1 UPF0102 protein yraN [Treponema brennaborense DSM 12168]
MNWKNSSKINRSRGVPISTRSVGLDGENRAAAYLESAGYSVLFRNWRTRCGEIDIIARKGSVLVFAEVKTLPSGNVETLAHELGARKRKRIIETAKYFLAMYRQYNDSCIRFDVLVVDMPGFDPIYHIENAFSEFI